MARGLRWREYDEAATVKSVVASISMNYEPLEFVNH